MPHDINISGSNNYTELLISSENCHLYGKAPRILDTDPEVESELDPEIDAELEPESQSNEIVLDDNTVSINDNNTENTHVDPDSTNSSS